MRIEWLESAIFDLQRLREFILPYNREAAKRAFNAIRSAVAPLAANPRIGRPVEELPNHHDLIIPFGASGYILRYRLQDNTIFIIAVKHGKEAGFASQHESGVMVHDAIVAYNAAFTNQDTP